MNARVYDPYLGRFLSADPVLPDAGNMQEFNRYAYVTNNPLKYVDPTGNSGFNVTFSFNFGISGFDPFGGIDALQRGLELARELYTLAFLENQDVGVLCFVTCLNGAGGLGDSGNSSNQGGTNSQGSNGGTNASSESGVGVSVGVGFGVGGNADNSASEDDISSDGGDMPVAEATPVLSALLDFGSRIPQGGPVTRANQLSCTEGDSDCVNRLARNQGLAAAGGAVVIGAFGACSALSLGVCGAVISTSLIADSSDPIDLAPGGKVARDGLSAAKGLLGQSGRNAFGKTKLRGLNQNRPLSELTDTDIRKTFKDSPFTLTNHAISRILDPRTRGLGARTPNDIAGVLNNGTISDAGRGLISIRRDGLEAIVNAGTKTVVTIKPVR